MSVYILIYFSLCYCSYYFYKLRKNLPKQYKKFTETKNNYKRVEIDRDRYNLKKVPTNIDTIVIGSGIGGLSCAAYLSRVGKKVLVLEQH